MSYPIAGLDMASAIPIYTFAEKHFLKQGFSPEEASIKADMIVRNAHGSAGVADLPAVLKGPETSKPLPSPTTSSITPTIESGISAVRL
jgi:hypothetical protein